jgi:hypothetical protein
MPGEGDDAIGLDQKPEGTGEPDRSGSAPRHRVGVVVGFHMVGSRKPTRAIAQELNRHSIQADTVRRLLEDMDYSLQVNRKVKEGPQDPGRDGQFRYINHRVNTFRLRGTRSFRLMPRSTTPSQHKSAFGLSISLPTNPKKHPLYARPRKQWRLARGKGGSEAVNK